MADSLFTRAGNAFTHGGATEAEQAVLRDALAANPAPVTADQLPAAAHQLLRELETRNRYAALDR